MLLLSVLLGSPLAGGNSVSWGCSGGSLYALALSDIPFIEIGHRGSIYTMESGKRLRARQQVFRVRKEVKCGFRVSSSESSMGNEKRAERILSPQASNGGPARTVALTREWTAAPLGT